jgi:hypothetical protein
MLEKMGFTGVVGKTFAKRQDPIIPQMRQKNEGLGKCEAEVREAKRAVAALKNRDEKDQMAFRDAQRSANMLSKRRKQFTAALRMASEFDEKTDQESVWREAYSARQAIVNEEERTELEEAVLAFFYQENLDLNRVSANLTEVLTYLRTNYNYCFYCGVKYESEEDLDSNCPGIEEELH